MIYRFIKDNFCVEDAHKIKETKRLSSTKKGAELEEEMDVVTQADVSFRSGGLTEDEARNEIFKLEAGFKQAGNNKTIDKFSKGSPAMEDAAKSGGRRLSLEALTRDSVNAAKSLGGRGRSLNSLTRVNEGDKDSVDILERTRSMSVLEEPTSRVSEGKDVSSGTTKGNEIPTKVRKTYQSRRSRSTSILPPRSPEFVRTIGVAKKKDTDQDSVGIVERTGTIPLSENPVRRASDGSVNRGMTKNGRIPRKSQSRKSSSVSELLPRPVSPRRPNMKESKGDKDGTTPTEAVEPQSPMSVTATSPRSRSSSTSSKPDHDLVQLVRSEAKSKEDGGKQGRRNSLTRSRRLSLPLPLPVEREKSTSTEVDVTPYEENLAGRLDKM
jgi:hypothetical protein